MSDAANAPSILLRLRRRAALLLLSVVRHLEGRSGSRARVWALRAAGAKLGDDIYIGPTVHIQAPWLLQAGNRVSVHEFCILACHGGLRIGSDVSIAHSSSILTTSHLYVDLQVPIRDQGVEESPVEIQDNVWIGCGTRILCGSTVESGVVVGANSVVRGDLPRNTICAGTPAEVKKTRTGGNAS